MQPTHAELAVLRRLTEPGSTVASVARQLGISEHAANKRLRSLYRRINVTSQAQAIWKLRHRGSNETMRFTFGTKAQKRRKGHLLADHGR